jgi:diaminopimelate epimerase
MELAFSKYNGCGNDFILIDNRSRCFPVANAPFIQRLCERQRGIGADGLILLESSASADFRMRIFNADGFETEMCGNGARCIVKFARELGMSKSAFTIETMHRILHASLNEAAITIDMGIPLDIEWSIPVSVNEISLTLHHLNTGVPHAVIFVEDIEDPKWMKLAPKIRSHPYFPAKGVNVNFAAIQQTEILIRTYERGVEGETLACGTGATATAITAAVLYKMEPPVSIRTRSGDLLKIKFEASPEIQHVYMEGPASCTFKGKFISPLFS